MWQGWRQLEQWIKPVVDPAGYIDQRRQELGIKRLTDVTCEQLLQQLRWQLKQLKLSNVDFGGLQQMLAGQGSEFLELREYVAGDDLRKIDWHVYARTQVPHVREMMAERQLTVWLVIDLTASMSFGQHHSKVEKAIELALCFGLLAQESGHRIGLYCFDGHQDFCLPAGGGNQQLSVMTNLLLQQLDDPQPRNNKAPLPKLAQPLEDALSSFNLLVKKNAMVFLFSDFLETTRWEKPLSILAHRTQLYALRLIDERERSVMAKLPDGFPISLWDEESGEQVSFSPVEALVSSRYNELLSTLESEIQNKLSAATGFRSVPTNLSIQQFLGQMTQWPIQTRNRGSFSNSSKTNSYNSEAY